MRGLIFIFSKIKETLNSAKEIINNVSLSKKLTVAVMAFALCVGLFFSVSGITGGFKVNYSGSTFIVKNVSDFEAALEKAKESIICENPEDYLASPVYTAVVTLPDAFEKTEDIIPEILENTKGLTYAASVSVNGESTAFVEASSAEKAVLDTLEQYAWSVDDKVQFVDEVKITRGYHPNVSELASEDRVIELLSELDVKTVSTKVTDKKVAYETVNKKVSTLESGKKVVTQEGKDGLNRVTEEVTYLNGEYVGTTTVATEVLTAPVDKVVNVGTKVVVKTVATNASSKESASKLGFVYPISRRGTVVTSYWGDGRGHKGIDIAGPVGTHIYAAQSGTAKVVKNGGAYGIYVEVDHGNGYVTRYAHCSAVAVKNGQKVSAGQVIAYVGNTGRTTGPHLHFEVFKNGTRVNPRAYIGL